MLTYHERKARLPFGAVTRIAEAHGAALSSVTHVLKGVHRNRAIERSLAATMVPRTSVSAAFGPAAPERMRKTRAVAAGVAE